jgi:hypothetical protein
MTEERKRIFNYLFLYYSFCSVPIVASVQVESLRGRLLVYGPPESGSRISLSFDELPKLRFKGI